MQPENLEQCAQYFVHGSLFDQVGGLIVVAVFIVTALTRHNVPDFVRRLGVFLMAQKKEAATDLEKTDPAFTPPQAPPPPAAKKEAGKKV